MNSFFFTVAVHKDQPIIPAAEWFRLYHRADFVTFITERRNKHPGNRHVPVIVKKLRAHLISLPLLRRIKFNMVFPGKTNASFCRKLLRSELLISWFPLEQKSTASIASSCFCQVRASPCKQKNERTVPFVSCTPHLPIYFYIITPLPFFLCLLQFKEWMKKKQKTAKGCRFFVLKSFPFGRK